MLVNNLFYEMELEAEVSSYYPARPAPVCSNHDSQKYSDPGDDAEIEYELYVILNIRGKTHRIPLADMERVKSLQPLVDDIYRYLTDDVIEDADYQYSKLEYIDAREYK